MIIKKITNKLIYPIVCFFILCTANGMEKDLRTELPLKNEHTFIREFPLMTAKLACYMYHRCSDQEKSAIETGIRQKNETTLLKRFQLISTTFFDQLKTNKIPEMFVYDFPIMSAEKSYTKYNQLPKTTQDSIKNLVKNTKNKIFIEIFTFTTQIPSILQNKVFSYQLDNTQAQQIELNKYHQISLWKLYSQLASHYIKQRAQRLYLASITLNPPPILLSDVQLLQQYYKVVP